MVNVNVALVRLLQFVIFVIFTFMVLVYFGTFLLLPLDAVILGVKLLTVFGINDLIATIIIVPVIGYLVMVVYKTPKLYPMLLDIGMEMVNTGKARVEAFNKVAESLKD